MLSIDYQTTEQNVRTDSEDFPSFTRDEPLHPLLDVLSVNDEKEESLSSKPRTRRKNIPWFNIDPIPTLHGNDS